MSPYSTQARGFSPGRLARLLGSCMVVVGFWLWMAAGGHLLAQEVDPTAPEAPQLLAPQDGAVTTGQSHPPLGVPVLQWTPVADATRYRVQVSESAAFADPVVEKTTVGTSYVPTEALKDGTYYWRVRAEQGAVAGPYSETRRFTKDWSNGGALAPQLLSPAHDSEIAAFGHQDFRWSPVYGAATYRLEVALDEGFTNLVYSATAVKHQHTPTARFANNRYYWRVTPVDAAGNYSQSSPVWSFVYNWNTAPQLLAPDDGLEPAYVPRFQWTAVEGAHTYQLEISTEEDFSSKTIYQTANTEYTPVKQLNNDQDYYWRVKAIDYGGHSSPWSEVRHFRTRWYFQPTLLTPANNAILQSYPFFSWTPIPGVERYQIQIDKSSSFDRPIADIKIYNVTSYAQPEWRDVLIEGSYYWRVRGIDAEDNYTPWSDTRAFRVGYTTTPNPIYPPYYYPPNTAELPVHRDETVAWPLFIWDSALSYNSDTGLTQRPDYYQLTVSSDPAFQTINFQIETLGNAAAPTLAHPFNGLVDGQTYYWRVRAYKDGGQMGSENIWLARIDRGSSTLPVTESIQLIYPADAFEAVEVPPILGWLPVAGADRYRVQVSRDRDFTDVVDEATATHLNYVPWQGRLEAMPMGTYWWRVQAQDASGSPLGGWSEVRHFNLSYDLIMGNPYDFVPPATSLLDTQGGYDPLLTQVATSPDGGWGAYELGDLHIMLNRPTGDENNLYWVIAFGTPNPVTGTVRYGLYVDVDHREGEGGSTDPMGKPIAVDPLYAPDYVLYIDRNGDTLDAGNSFFLEWDGQSWMPRPSLAGIGGQVHYDSTTQAVQLQVPFTALGAGREDFVGSLAITVFSTTTDPADGLRDSLPVQAGTLNRPAFVSDMLTPLYPFDTPLSNPFVFQDMPPIRWRTPYFDSVDGYQVQLAKDPKFTQVVEEWETYESSTWSFFTLLPATFQSIQAREDNESYYWRVRIRHERYRTSSSYFDYGPWSPPMRFKLSSRVPTNPRVIPEGVVTTPTFVWDRVEGAAGYVLQVDDDANFSKPVIDVKVGATSYTWTDPLPDGTYYWRVAIRRSDKVMGQWTAPMSFTKRSLAPTLLSPVGGVVINEQPTFTWAPVLTNTGTLRMAAPRYRLQISGDPNFSNPATYTTESTTYTPAKRQTLPDGTYYWRVAVIDADNNLGAYSEPQSFYKEYLPPHLMEPQQGAAVTPATVFRWDPIHGAANYRIQIDEDPFFGSAESATTDNAAYAATKELKGPLVYWRVQMLDEDNNPGPYEVGQVALQQFAIYLPLVANP
ncbi:fibronectin type III domain-containing protein [Litorilinea aerophila]|uniref:Fibronectin type-III domain-containing protein n=1 Tax=Litorilinea aerophila TaxID=1204385 RepID=A0A540VBI3_9CHLR|nr:fibronectin type III domain-containing protein [Litorilinea aerophila]MCC9078013.1 fibronectin type III domain-containing protein [Litorilinea aerophila]